MMTELYRLPSDEAPRYVGVDMGSGDDFTAEVEIEILPDGAIRVLGIRQFDRNGSPIARDKPA